MSSAEEAILAALDGFGWDAEPQPFRLVDRLGVTGAPTGKRLTVHRDVAGTNLIGVRLGSNPREAVVVMAHYDTVSHCPGANDNTASVAVLLELARLLADLPLRRSVILACPDLEELGILGSAPLVEHLTRRFRLVGAINFECMGYVTEEAGSQRLPPGIGWLYPRQAARIRSWDSAGAFTAVIHDGSGRRIARRLVQKLEVECGADVALAVQAPAELPIVGRLLQALPGIRHFGRSDHIHFWRAGIPAAMVTDTANFRYPWYHGPEDTWEKLDYTRLAAIGTATAGVIRELCGPAPRASPVSAC